MQRPSARSRVLRRIQSIESKSFEYPRAQPPSLQQDVLLLDPYCVRGPNFHPQISPRDEPR